MSPMNTLSLALALVLATSAQGLKCNEGFNMNLGGIPLYHWVERTCAENSKCFIQELKGTYGLPVAMRYGACLSAAYATYLDCDTLFGSNSTFDPANLLDMIPDLTKRVNDTIQDFVKDAMGQLKILLSNGQGTMEFIDGVFMFYKRLGFNMKNAEPLKQPLANLLSDSFSGNQTVIQQRAAEVLNAIANLDTENMEYTNAIYNLINNIDPTGAAVQGIKNDPAVKPLVERLPGLVRSMLNDSFSPAQWYDVTFKLLNNLNITLPKKTAEDMVATINATYWDLIPDDVKTYVNPLFERIPDLVDKLAQGNFEYAGNWSLNVLMKISEVDNATTQFSEAFIEFLETIARTTLQYEFRMTIKWVPGLLYKFFPNDKAEIGEAYIKIADGLKTFNFTDITDTAQPTDLSDLVISLVESNTGTALDDFSRALIINFARMFYNLLSDYSSGVEKFFSILKTGLSTWPNINTGKLIKDLITGLNGTVPPEIDPLLTNLQPIITEAMQAASPTGLNATALFGAMTMVVDAYKTAYPHSPFPEIVENYIKYYKEMVEFDWSQADAGQKYMNISTELQLLQIDLQFAIMNSFNNTTDEFTQMIIKAFPQYETYIKLMQAMKPEDVKQLMREIMKWAMTGPYTAEAFVSAIKPTVQKITASINAILGNLRKIFQPESCKYSSCDTELCNAHEYNDSQNPLTTMPSDSTIPNTGNGTTTSAGEHVTAGVLLNIASSWIAYKVFLG